MKAWRIAVFERDNYTCRMCGQIGGRLEADHIWPVALKPEIALLLENGRTLCQSCHANTDTFQSGTASMLREVFTNAEEREAFTRGREIIMGCFMRGERLPDAATVEMYRNGVWEVL